MTLEEFVNEIVLKQDKEICVYTKSIHRDKIASLLDEMVDEHPEYYNVAYCLGVYPLQKWAKEVRSKIGLDQEELITAIKNNDSFYGINIHSEKDMEFQKKSLEIADKMVSKVDQMISEGLKNSKIKQAENIYDIFDYNSDAKTSMYLINTYFKEVLDEVFSKYFLEFDELMEEWKNIAKDVDQNIVLAYHDIETLLSVMCKIKKSKMHQSDLSKYDLDIKKLHDNTEKTIKGLENYPFCKDVQRVIYLIFQGYGEFNISNYLKKSRTYVHHRYKLGLIAMEYIIWGFELMIN